MSSPFFSIIMPTYNRAKFLKDTIKSVIEQTYTNWELIIVDDGSTDNTSQVVQSFAKADDRIKYFYQTNQKISAARNTGLLHSTGTYICFLDSDDQYLVNHLALFYKTLEQRNFDKCFIYTRFSFADAGKTTEHIPQKGITYGDEKLQEIMQVFLPYSPPVQTICVPGESKKNILFDRKLIVTECYDYCIQCAKKYPVVHLPISTVTLFGHDENISVPRNNDASIIFNSRQYTDMLTLKTKPGYASIVATKAYRARLQYLQLELAKCYAQKRQPIKTFNYSYEGLCYNPIYIFSKKFVHFSRAVITSFLKGKAA